MKKINKFILTSLLLVTAGVSVSMAAACSNDENLPEPADRGNWTVSSPDKTLKSDITMNGNGELSYTVKKGDVTVIEKSDLGFDILEDDFRICEIVSAETIAVSGSYENISGKHSQVEYSCNEFTLTLKGYEFYLEVVMRTYDDGYAFRYNIRAIDGEAGTMTVVSENTQFAIPSTSYVWTQVFTAESGTDNCFAYETPYRRRSATKLGEESLSMPLLYQIKDTDTYSLITESGLIGSGFYGSFLEEDEAHKGTGVFKTEHTPAGAAKEDNVVGYPFSSPWRIGITGDMKTVIESELVEKVYDDAEYWKPDNYDELSEEEKEIYNYDWVDAGAATWCWLIETTPPTDPVAMHKSYVDSAAALGYSYYILDAGWNNIFNKAGMIDFVKYANEKGVKIIVWCDSLYDFAGGNYNSLTSSLEKWKGYGISGIKIDFFDGLTVTNPKFQGEDIEAVKWYETIYRECAKRQMVVNCHGCNKPTGERRVYPNVINRESVQGNEVKAVDASVTVNSMFVRSVIGPTDFTPVVNPLSKGLTQAHCMALAVLYESGMPCMADYPATYQNEDINAFYKAIPALRDDIIFLGGEPDTYYLAAIKAGDDWFVAGINALLPSEVEIDFGFLGEGTFTAELFCDPTGEDKAVEKSVVTLTGESSSKINMAKNGGFVYHITKSV